MSATRSASMVARGMPYAELAREPPTRYGISSLSRTSRTRLNASARVFMQFGIPSVGPDHQVPVKVAGCGSQENFALAGLRILHTNARLGNVEYEVAKREHVRNLLPERFLPMQ